MPQTRLRLEVLVRETRPVSRWGEPGLLPAAVRAPGAGPEGTLRPAGTLELLLHSGETGHYRDNLASGRPAIWVALRKGRAPALVAVTANPYEGEALAGDDGLVVEAVAMPEAVRAALAAFVAQHHVERPFEKRRRRRADPEALARRAPGDRR